LGQNIADPAFTDGDENRHDMNNTLSLVLAYAERALRAADDPVATRAILSDLIASVTEQAALAEERDTRD